MSDILNKIIATKHEEIAAAMSVTVATVKSRLFRARQQLAALYQQRESASQPPASGPKAKPMPALAASPAQNVMHLRLGMAN